MRIEIMDSTDFKFEKGKYNTIILDPPYTSEENYQKNFMEKSSTKWSKTHDGFNEKPLKYSYKINLFLDRIFQYSFMRPTWVIYFYNRPLLLSRYRINWVREKEGLGWNIGRNTEYIHLVNYSGLRIKTVAKARINETEFIPKPRTRTCAKPTELYKKLFVVLESKNIFDPFAGWANSVIAAKDLGLEIDALDIDESLQERYKFLKKYRPSRIDSFIDFTGVESET